MYQCTNAPPEFQREDLPVQMGRARQRSAVSFQAVGLAQRVLRAPSPVAWSLSTGMPPKRAVWQAIEAMGGWMGGRLGGE